MCNETTITNEIKFGSLPSLTSLREGAAAAAASTPHGDVGVVVGVACKSCCHAASLPTWPWSFISQRRSLPISAEKKTKQNKTQTPTNQTIGRGELGTLRVCSSFAFPCSIFFFIIKTTIQTKKIIKEWPGSTIVFGNRETSTLDFWKRFWNKIIKANSSDWIQIRYFKKTWLPFNAAIGCFPALLPSFTGFF